MSTRPAPRIEPLLSIVAHELRSPLNGIKSWTHVLEGRLGGGDADALRAIAGIMTGVDQQVRLIEDLLEGAPSDEVAPGTQAMSLRPALADAVESLRATAAEKGVELVADYANAECSIAADPAQARAMLASLVANAIRFTGRDSTLRIGVFTDANRATVTVSDHGAQAGATFDVSLPLIRL